MFLILAGARALPALLAGMDETDAKNIAKLLTQLGKLGFIAKVKPVSIGFRCSFTSGNRIACF